ncbi:hypothetical protein DDZ14_03425 [Maritimibacter sp. 55A14]|uniref:hypothetical protein n=1 Tax=Maritimibacter sp. 55A14 TaxID=2174844 RepID=UPI000D621C63|nr:hypothetical protein [Maritimibacter sp. 55A14]PWE33728.1 hypothetical protein DDZ14_03425 [Maritimibacter sp. 55A14]
MAAITTNSGRNSDLRQRIDMFFARMGQGVNAYLERRSRRDRIEELEAMSDAELARIGLTRERILHYVFRDIYYL